MEAPPANDLVWYFTSEELEAMEAFPIVFRGLPQETAAKINRAINEHIQFDDAYFARRLPRKNPEPFVM